MKIQKKKCFEGGGWVGVGGRGGGPIRNWGGGGGGSKVWGRWVMWGYGRCKQRIKGIEKCK